MTYNLQQMNNYTNFLKAMVGSVPSSTPKIKILPGLVQLSLKTRKDLVFGKLSKLLAVCVGRFLKSIEKSLLNDNKPLEWLQFNSSESQDQEVVLLTTEKIWCHREHKNISIFMYSQERREKLKDT